VENKFRLVISLDGDEEGHSYRIFAKNNKSSFKQVIANIDMIQRNFPAYFADNVMFNAVLHNRNSVKSIYEFVYNRYHKIPHISQLSRGGISLDKKDIFDRMFLDKRKSEEMYESDVSNPIPGIHESFIVNKKLNYFIKSSSINFYILNALYLLYGKSKMYPTATCMPFSLKIFLNTQHDLLPCENVHNKFAFGKVNQNVNIDIPGMVKKFNFYFDRFQKNCQLCYTYRCCDVCFLKTRNLDELDTGEFVCYGFQNQEAFKNEMSRMLSLLEKEPNIFFQILN
jgi:uncharacterized protein